MAKTQSRLLDGKMASVAAKQQQQATDSNEGENAFPVAEGDDKPRSQTTQQTASPSEPSITKDTPGVQYEMAPPDDMLGQFIGFAYLDPHKIKDWKYKDRTKDELEYDKENLEGFEEEVRRSGFSSSIVVRPINGKDGKGGYEEVVGFKRTYMARKLNKPVPAEIRILTDEEALALQETENKYRSAPSWWSKARAWLRMEKDFGETQQERAKAVGATPSQFSTALRIARDMPEEIVKSIRLYTLGYNSIAKLMQYLDLDKEDQSALIDRVIEVSDEIERKPTKAESVFNRLIDEYYASGSETQNQTQPEVAKTPKGGKVYTIKRGRSGVSINLHQIGMELADMDEIRKLLRDHLVKKGVQFEE